MPPELRRGKGRDSPVGGLIPDSHTGEQRRLEPASDLVFAFHVYISHKVGFCEGWVEGVSPLAAGPNL